MSEDGLTPSVGEGHIPCDDVGVAVRFETARLVIRDLQHDDLVGMTALWGDERVAQFMGNYGPRTPDEVAEWLHRTIAVEQQEPRGSMNLTVAQRSDGAVVGWIGMGRDDRGVADWDFGYAIHPDHRGQGYATEALTAALDYCVKTLGLSVWAQCDIANRASAHVMLGAGMTEITSPTAEDRRFRVERVSR
jgi:RimJ/RimL family protein N-acetyltransferase